MALWQIWMTKYLFFLSSCKPHWPTTIFHKRTNERLRTRRKRCWLRTSINRPPAEPYQTTKLFYKITSNYTKFLKGLLTKYKVYVSMAPPVASILPSDWHKKLGMHSIQGNLGGELLKDLLDSVRTADKIVLKTTVKWDVFFRIRYKGPQKSASKVHVSSIPPVASFLHSD